MLTKTFWLGENGVLVRAMRTWAQTAVAAIGVGQTNLFTADIKNTLALATSAAVVSILMSMDRNAATGSPMVIEATTAVVPVPKLQADYASDTR